MSAGGFLIYEIFALLTLIGAPPLAAWASPGKVIAKIDMDISSNENIVANNSQNRHKIKLKVPFSSLPNKLDSPLRLNAICPYYTMFPLDFPFNALSQAKAGEWVLDPFCGRGTTNFAARLKGLPSIGIDTNPVATAIAKSKLVSSKPEKIVKLCKKIIEKDPKPEKIPEETFWKFCFNPDTLNQICKLREHFLLDCSTDNAIALRSLILGILHGPIRKGQPTYLSNQMPRTYATKPNSAINFWEKRGLFPPDIDVLDVVKRRADYLFASLPPKSQGKILQTDSRGSLESRIQSKFQWVITSPPYYGMSTYTQDQWLRKWFLGGESYVDYHTQNQLSQGSESDFIESLTQVWKSVGEVCANGANLIIRFGSLPSYSSDPASLLEQSLGATNGDWEIVSVNDAGISPRGKRQSEQFKQNNLGSARNEVDLRAVFMG